MSFGVIRLGRGGCGSGARAPSSSEKKLEMRVLKRAYWRILSTFAGWFFYLYGIGNKSFALSVYEPLNNTMITIITQAMTHYQAYAVLLTQMYTICLEPS